MGQDFFIGCHMREVARRRDSANPYKNEAEEQRTFLKIIAENIMPFL